MGESKELTRVSFRLFIKDVKADSVLPFVHNFLHIGSDDQHLTSRWESLSDAAVHHRTGYGPGSVPRVVVKPAALGSGLRRAVNLLCHGTFLSLFPNEINSHSHSGSFRNALQQFAPQVFIERCFA